MVALEPSDDFNLEEFVLQEEYAATPALGFTFFWHSRHDQVKTAPGRIHCRLCKADRRAGEFVSPCRRHSCLAAVATMGSEQPGPSVVRELRAPEGLEENRELLRVLRRTLGWYCRRSLLERAVLQRLGRKEELQRSRLKFLRSHTTDEVTEQNMT